ncbi:MAG: metallophosphoesterase family protein [Bacillota bacterium]|nr:metallophosphoesterase family protein [Bacillota bacterium]
MICITGDTHIPIDIGKLSTKRFPAQKVLTKEDYLIICGDFGGVWDNSNEEKYWIKWLCKKNFTTIFIDGNHENYSLLNELPVVPFAHKINDGIYHLIRGEVFTIDNKKIFTFGGASSHDRQCRKEGINWWKEEVPSEGEYIKAIHNLDICNWKVDYIITHCIASSIQRQIDSTYDENELTDFLDMINNKLSYKKWFFGHYHLDKEVDQQHTVIFNRIIAI